ncbi:hypothetical protein K438DRAFT_1816331 [Mycena galopus ATCC 62051]|nr:hypothetical protein K438DRAFT_1816331 [Mycena galopus ATCC 62051]
MIHLRRAFFLSLLSLALFPFLLLLSLRCVALGRIRERFSDRRPFSRTLASLSFFRSSLSSAPGRTRCARVLRCGCSCPCARDSVDVLYLTSLTLTLRTAYPASARPASVGVGFIGMGVDVRGPALSHAFIFLSFFEDTISRCGLGATVSYCKGKGSSPRRAHVHPSHTFPLMVLLVVANLTVSSVHLVLSTLLSFMHHARGHRIKHMRRSVLLVLDFSSISQNQSAFLSPSPVPCAR